MQSNKVMGNVMIAMVAIRLLLAVIDLNFDYPDQYWQGPQIAYKIATGHGYESWEWTMAQPIRNPVYQYFLAIGYKLTMWMGCSTSMIELSPKLMQVPVALLSDFFLLKTIHLYYSNLSWKVLMLVLTNWYYLSMMSRTFINGWETALTITAFYFWKMRTAHSSNDLISRVVVTLTYISRPTSILVWAVIWPYQLLTRKTQRIQFIIKNIIQIAIMVALSMLIGSLYFQRMTSTDFNFFKYNILLKWSEVYGVHPYAYYFYASIPLLLGAYLSGLIHYLYDTATSLLSNPKIIKENKKGINKQGIDSKQQLLLLTLIILVILSFSTHKEHRFILIILPFLLILCIKGFITFSPPFKSLLLALSIAVNAFLFISVALYGKTDSFTMLHQMRSTERSSTIAYLSDPHALPAYSKVITPAQILIPDSSPIRKLSHSDQTQLLIAQPEQLFDRLRNGKTVDLIVCQWKYLYKKGQLRPQYNFILKGGYQLIGSYRNCLIWEEYFGDGIDGFVLFKKSNP